MRAEVKSIGGHSTQQYLSIILDRALVFPSVSYVRNTINKAGIKEGESKLPLVLDCSHVFNTDFTAAEGFKSMISDFKKRNQAIIFYNTAPDVQSTFEGVRIKDFHVVHSFEELLEHLQELLEGPNVNLIKGQEDECEISITQ